MDRLGCGALMLLGTLLLRPFGLSGAKRAVVVGEETSESGGEEIRDLVDDMVEFGSGRRNFDNGLPRFP